MLKRKLFLILILFTANFASAQNSAIQMDILYINVSIAADKTVYVETDKSRLEDIKGKISEIIRNKPFKLDQKIVYRIFADENLKLGYILDVNNKMLPAYSDNVRTKRFLLNTTELSVDGQNWFKSIDMKKLKKVN